jgi:RNA polymerase sigma factor (sigma-70 family)
MGASASVDDLEAVYRAHFLRFLRVATAIVGDEARGADAVQEAFVQALRARRGYRGEAPLDAWVWRVVVNAALAARKTMEPVLVDVPVRAAANGRHGDDEFGVRRWIAVLPERQRVAIFLRYFADLDYRAIAAALDVEVGTVSATLNAAHAALRRSLEEVQR